MTVRRGFLWIGFIVVVAIGSPFDLTGATAAESVAPLFGGTNVWTFHLELTSSQWATLQPREDFGPGGRRFTPGPAEREYPWSTATFSGAGESFTNVSLRFKGNSSFNMSRSSLKRPFKLDFNRGAKGRTLLGQQEVVLNNNVNDATQFREALAYELFRRAGIPAPRTAFARVYLTVSGVRTNEYLGLYTVVEPVEGQFLRDRFGNRNGLLLKPERVRGLEYLGPTWAAYTARYEPKTEGTSAEREQFMELTRIIAEADELTFVRELPRRLDVPAFLRFVAVNALLANYDSFLGTGHNYYGYLPVEEGLFRFIPWDLNETFGGHPGAGPRRAQAEFSILQPHVPPNRLMDRVLSQPEWADRYRQELRELTAGVMAPTTVLELASVLAATVQDAVQLESPAAWASFQRVALGREVPMPRPPFEPSPGNEPPPGSRPGGPRPQGFARFEDGTLADWYQRRLEWVKAELEGKRTGTRPQLRPGPGPGIRGPGPRPPGI